jgi:zinc protease
MKVTREDILKYIRNYVAGKYYVAGMVINGDMNKSLNPGSFFKTR